MVSDAVMTFAMKAAEEIGVPEVQFWTASACGLMGYCQYKELVRRGIIPFKDDNDFTNGYLDTPLEWIPGSKGLMRLRDMPAFCRTTNPDDTMVHFMIEQISNCTKSSGIIVNTLQELEQDIIHGLEKIFPKIYAIGPLNLLVEDMPNEDRVELDSTMWTEDSDTLAWLDSKTPGSVIYINFGSVGVMTEDQMTEFAWGSRQAASNSSGC
ncbi:hypothetical protein MLD38_030634 [Melastoma candidum]|uniref:Uncharacterized protein n=1 Tax=Melastoma candidum TaxID=119954 RepID=A0ACB9MNT8_9MYRT|nr:hypothetical protein MLD38_030634 [Melastoma candidum]